MPEAQKKFSAPTRYDQGKYLERWVSYRDDGEPQSYIQVGEDPENPRWITLAQFYITCFMEEDELFIYECALLFHANENKLLQKKEPVA